MTIISSKYAQPVEKGKRLWNSFRRKRHLSYLEG
jgi:hypothetical protein